MEKNQCPAVSGDCPAVSADADLYAGGFDSLVPGYAVLYGPRNAYSFYLVPGQQQEITKLNGQEIKFTGAAKAINIYLNSPFLNNRDPGYEKGEEEFLKEDGKYYVVIRAVHGKQQYDKECFYRFGEELILAKHPVLLEYLDQEYVKYSKIKESLTDDSKEHIRRRKEEVEDLLGDIMEALCYYEL